MKKAFFSIMLLMLLLPHKMWAQCPDGAQSCSITIVADDVLGDGWNGAAIEVYQDTILRGTATLTAGYSAEIDVVVCSGQPMRFVYVQGPLDGEVFFSIVNGDGSVIIADAAGLDYSNGQTIAMAMPACPSCVRPMHLHCVPDSDFATLSWTALNGETSWLLSVNGQSPMVIHTNPYVLGGLAQNVNYQVSLRALCSSSDTSEAISATFRTGCSPLQLPYFNNFDAETMDEPPSCWNVLVPFGANPKVFDEMAYSGSQSLFFAEDHGYSIITAPMIPVPGNEISVTFKAYLEMGINIGGVNLFNSRIEGGVISDLSDTSTFIPLVLVDQMDNVWREYEFNTAQLDPTAIYYVAFRFYGESVFMGNGAIDDLSITHDNGCARPASLHVDSVGSHGALLSWTVAGNNATEYEIYYSTQNDWHTATLFLQTQDTFCLIDGLDQNTTYYVWIRTACDNLYSDFKAFQPFTTRLTCAPVKNVRLSNVNYTAAVLGWQYELTQGFPSAGTLVRLYDLMDSAAAPVEQYVTGNTAVFTNLSASHWYRAYFLNTCQMDYEIDTANVVSFDFLTESCSQVAGASNGQAASEYLLNTNYPTSYVQTLYRADEMPAVDTIRAVAFRAATRIDQTITFDLYMAQTDLTGLSTSAMGYVPYDSLMLVKQQFTLGDEPEGWKVIVLDTPVVYNNNRNLVVAAHSSSNSLYLSPIEWHYHNTMFPQTAEWNNYGPVSLQTPGSYFTSVHNGAADIRFLSNCSVSACLPPLITTTATDSTSAVVSWVATGLEDQFVAQYAQVTTSGSITSLSPYVPVGGTLFEDSVVINGLVPATTYVVRVGSLCDADTLWDYVSFTTQCGLLPIPYSEDFDAFSDYTMPPCWTYNPNYANHLLGGLIFSCDYPNVAPSFRSAVLPMLDVPIENLEINFRAKLGEIAYGDAILVGVADADGLSVEWLDTLSDNGQSRANYTWFSYDFASYTGTKERIALGYITADNSSAMYGAVVDDISVTLSSACPSPVQLTALHLDNPAGIVVSWGASGQASQYLVAWDTVGTPFLQASHVQTVNDTFYLMPPLVSGGKYTVYVKRLCSDSESALRSLDFAAGSYVMSHTSCDTVTACGLIIYDNGGPNGNYGHNSRSVLVVRPSGNDRSVVFNGGTIDLVAWGGDVLRVYEGEDTTGVLLFECTDTYGPEYFNTAIVSEEGPMTFYFTSNFVSNATGYELFTSCVDMPSCHRPKNISIDASAPDVAQLGWTGNAIYYDIYYRPQGTTNWNTVTAASSSATLTGLQAGTTYELRIQGHCADNELSPMSLTRTFTTACTAIEITPDSPLDQDFESSEAPANCFTMLSADESSPNTMVHSTARAYSGNRSFRFSSYHASNDYHQYLISPLLVSDDSLTLRFRYSDQMYGQEKMRVGYSIGGNNPDDFIWVDTLNTMGTTWLLYQNDFPAQTRFLAINYISNFRYYAFVDSLHIGVVASADCQMPVIEDVSESAEQVAVTFHSQGEVEAYITTQPWNDNVSGIVVSGESYAFTGLVPNTEYTIGLRSHCSNGLTSQWNTRTVTTSITGCEPPTGFSLEEVSYTSALFNWDDSGDASVWEINISNTSFNQNYIVTEVPYLATGLSYDISYRAKIRSVCGGLPGEWSDSIVAFTTPICEPVSQLQWTLHTDVESGASLELSWEGSAESYQIEYGQEHFDAGAGMLIDHIQGTHYTLGGLEYGTSYDVYIRAHCAEGINSQWSQCIHVHPSNNDIDVTEQEPRMTLYPNPTTGYVTVVLGDAAADTELQVIDINGRVAHSEILPCSGQCRKQVDLSQLPKGVYFIRIRNAETQLVRKLVVK